MIGYIETNSIDSKTTKSVHDLTHFSFLFSQMMGKTQLIQVMVGTKWNKNLQEALSTVQRKELLEKRYWILN
jgi:hypothetical protein